MCNVVKALPIQILFCSKILKSQYCSYFYYFDSNIYCEKVLQIMYVFGIYIYINTYIYYSEQIK